MSTAKKPFVLAAAITAALIALPLAVAAQSAATDNCAKQLQAGGCLPAPGPHDQQPTFPHPPRPLPLAPELHLTEAQQAQITSLSDAQHGKIKPLMDTAMQAQHELQQLARSAQFDQRKASELAEKHALTLSQIDLLHAELDVNVRALLSPEQQVVFAQTPACHQRPRPE
jgi:Spy/CpxP family protein refolding chaperone